MSDGASNFRVGASLTVGDVEQRTPALKLKVGATEIQRERELAALSGKVFVELAQVWSERGGLFLQVESLGVDWLNPRRELKPDQSLS